MSTGFDSKTLEKRYLDILAAARKHFVADFVQREELRVWYEETYGKKQGAKKAYVPAQIIKNGYLQRGNGSYWLDLGLINKEPLSDSEFPHSDELEIGSKETGGERTEAEAESFDAQERAAGFQPNPEIRRAVEKYAMDKAKEKLGSLGFVKFTDTSKQKCYDYTCERGGRLYYVEVKGTQGKGESVILTENEVKHGHAHQQDSIAVIVHHITVDVDGGALHATGGTTRLCEPWVLEPARLKPIQYTWTLSKCSEVPST